MAEIKNNRSITIDRLKSVLDYNSDTGIFVWKVTISPKAVAGSRAGAIRKRGYRVITIDGEQHKASRLAWLYSYGELPAGLIDHKNLDRTDDRLENLRISDHAENAWNVGLSKRNTSGVKGVSRSENGWQAKIAYRSKRVHLGYFKSIDEAASSYENAARKFRGEFARLA